MRSEHDKMLAGALYDAADPALAGARRHARALCRQLNQMPMEDSPARDALLVQLFGAPVRAGITPPFFCDYGSNITLGDDAYFNCNCVILDVAPVHIGARSLFGPGVHIYAATHPMDAATRRRGLELGRPVHIGADVWVGGGAIICPGVHIGDGAVIGAGSVVTRDVPAGAFAAGNPCRVIRSL